MKNRLFFLTAAFLPLFTVQANAKNVLSIIDPDPDSDSDWWPGTTRKIINKPAIKPSVNVSYDTSTTVLTVNFSAVSSNGTVEILRNGSIVAGITAGGGTTFSCRLKDYGEGNYNIIVSDGKTVVYTKNITVR